MPLDLAGAYGADNMSQRIRQRMLDQLTAQQQQHRMALDDQAMQLRQQEAARAAEEFKLNLADRSTGRADALAAKIEAQQAAEDAKLGQSDVNAFTMNPIGTTLNPAVAGRLQMRGYPIGTVPAISAMAQGESGQDVSTPIVPEAKTRGTTQADIERKAAADLAARKLDEKPLPVPRAPVQVGPQGIYMDPQDAIGKPGYHPPKEGNEKLTRVEHKDPETGRTVIEYLPQSAIRGQKFEKGVLGATESRLASAEAVKQTGDDMIANLNTPEVRAKLGPLMGRYNTLKDFIGNPPPEFAELAGQIESYSLANMGVHGMRSAQGSRMIAALLDQHHTPESLIASIKGLNSFATHFMENEGRKVTGSNAAPIGPTEPKVENWTRDKNGKLVKQ